MRPLERQAVVGDAKLRSGEKGVEGDTAYDVGHEFGWEKTGPGGG